MSDKQLEIKRVGGDVIGAGIDGAGHIVGKQITIRGNVIQLVNPSPEAIAALNKLDAMPTAAVAPGGAGGIQGGKIQPDAPALQRSIDELLGLLKTTGQLGEHAQEIRGGGVQFSRADLLLKKASLIKTDAEQMHFDHLQKVKPQMDQARQRAGGGQHQIDLNAMFRDFDSGAHTAKLQEAYDLLQEANQLDPTNTEVLLNLAQLLIQLTPDDPTDEQRLLYRVQKLLSSPKDDAEQFRLAQATFLLSTSSQPLNAESLRDARHMFEKLGRREWVRQCDDLLASNSGGNPARGPQMNQPGAPPPIGFQPVGRWQFQITDAANSVMTVDFFPNGTFTAIQQAGPFGANIQAQGQWLFNPYNQTLQFQGMVGGFMPFMLGIAIQHPHLNGFYGIGSDNCAYFITQM